MTESKNIADLFGSMVFNDSVMRERLPENVYSSLRKTIQQGSILDENLAENVASVMKDWAIEKGATHYSHWFQPMTGITAEKHTAFLSSSKEGKGIMDFSGKELVKDESDASSFPNGGLRATFEARGYTAWDPTSYAFVKDRTLYIPTVFCSFGGEVLDKKTPLIRSMEALNTQALRILRIFGNTTVKMVTPSVGCEQEYFLIPKALYAERPDLIFTGRTMMGARPPKGQELEDHYYGNIPENVASYMSELDDELWKLGVSAKTEHNEAAPRQHELAPTYTSANTACDHNQLMMELMKRIADHHDMACLLHAKPFSYVNGSGKHNNWSLSTDEGENLFEPGSSPEKNARFLLFLCAVIKGVDEYADLLRISVATADNDYRLGSCEAPPSIISVFLGDDLESIFESLALDKPLTKFSNEMLEIGVSVLPRLPKDNTDRNRTAPLAFTGNKFEFRMLSSSASVSGPNIVLNTIMAEELRIFADRLEKSADIKKTLHDILAETYRENGKIIFGGNAYADEWISEAEKRGLHNYPTGADALPHLTDEKFVQLFGRHNIFSEAEINSRKSILLDNYIKALNIEATTMIDMVSRAIRPVGIRFTNEVLETYGRIKAIDPALPSHCEKELLGELCALMDELETGFTKLSESLKNAQALENPEEAAIYYRYTVGGAMDELRVVCDKLEVLMPTDMWPFPSYSKLMFAE